MFLIIWDPFWAHLDRLGPFWTKMIFLPQMDKVGVGRGASEQNINSCLKWSKKFLPHFFSFAIYSSVDETIREMAMRKTKVLLVVNLFIDGWSGY